MMIRIKSVETLDGFNVRLGLSDGRSREVDLEPYLHGPIFEPLKRDRKLWESVHVDPELETIVWDNGADICPDVLIHGRTPVAWQDQNT